MKSTILLKLKTKVDKQEKQEGAKQYSTNAEDEDESAEKDREMSKKLLK